MSEQIPLTAESRADNPTLDHENDDNTHEIADDLSYKRLAIVNVVFYGRPGAGDREWVLIDAGMSGSAGAIKRAATKRFGENSRPAAIVMTHGHFDHVGALETLADEWDTPIYAHLLEQPYLDGRSSYPPPDPSVGGGLMALTSPLFPAGPIDVGRRLRILPDSGVVPHMDRWRWIHTPGHAPGHVSFWREEDRALIVGDAFITTRQESAYAAMMQTPEMHGPPRYFTPDWDSARDSVSALAALEPELVVTGHGRAMRGEEMRLALHALARNFDEVARPEQGRYVDEPAQADVTGTTYVPPKL
ncbi:MAG TPA: MBL fold metallo-hydrolase [Chthoniobacterales bacterium]|nr:MBL fold metallo-hydrolase [Chthoniobacterales bacterium]